MGTPPLPQGALPPAPRRPPWAGPRCHQHPRCHGSRRALGERSRRCDPSPCVPVPCCRVGVLERRLCSPAALPWERPPAPHHAATSLRSQEQDTYQVEVLLGVQILDCEEGKRETQQLSRGTQTETCLRSRLPRQEAFCFPQEPQHQAGVPTPNDLSIVICFGVVYRLLGHVASTSGSTLRRTGGLPRGVLRGTQEGTRAGSAQGHSCTVTLCDGP